jgi:hypothetical protein
MADQSDVEAALAGVVGAALYPQGTAAPSVLGVVCRIYRGWPGQAALAADLAAGAVNVTIWPEASGQANTTRWPDVWQQTAVVAPSLAVAVAGDTATFSGSAGPGQVAGLLVDNVAVVHRTVAGDTPGSVAAVLGSYLRPRRVVQLSGASLTVPGAGSLIGRVVADQPGMRQTRRQRQNFRVTCWCPDPATRDRAGAAVDAALSASAFIGLADGTSGHLRFVSSALSDRAEDAGLFRRDLVYSVDYATTVASVLPSMIFGDATVSPPGGAPGPSLLS